MSKIKVLVVDDAVVIRKILSDVLAADEEIEIAGTAANGKIAMQRIEQLKPDIITLDVEMPEMDGIATLTAIKAAYPQIPVIMFSTLSERGAEITLEALKKGASDFVTKPANVGSVVEAKERVKNDLIGKIKSLCHKKKIVKPNQEFVLKAPQLPTRTKPKGPFKICCIGVSTGGPNALAAILPKLPQSFPVPILVVQHMPPVFTRLLAERLNSQSLNLVHEAVHGVEILPGNIYIAPGNYHLKIVKKEGRVFTELNQDNPENSCRPAVDVLFRSAVEIYKHETLAVILTGMGYDGTKGCAEIREKGGMILAQDELSSVVWGMPGSVVKAGLADEIVALADFPSAISEKFKLERVSYGVSI
jgi:two-component system chemotaxis response regulator CheB